MKYLLALLFLVPFAASAQDDVQMVAPEMVDDAYSPYSRAFPELVPELPEEYQELVAPAEGAVSTPETTEPETTEPEPLEPAKIEGKKARLQILDKINASVNEVEVELDKELEYQELKINVTRCLHSPQDSKEENVAFMRIWDIGQGDYTNIVFSGWMFSSNPALHSFEHSIYDVVLLKCLD